MGNLLSSTMELNLSIRWNAPLGPTAHSVAMMTLAFMKFHVSLKRLEYICMLNIADN